MLNKKYFPLFLFFSFASFQGVIANPLDLAKRAQISVDKYHSEIVTRLEAEDWRPLSFSCRNLIRDFPNSPFAMEAHYYLGVAFFQLGDYELANKSFSNYLKEELTPKFFNEVIDYKFSIAQAFESGAKRHLFGRSRLPMWLPAYEQAIEIYDEVITTMPRSDLAANSLYRKGMLLLELKEYQKSVASFQTLIRRFPKHPLAIESYIGINSVYLMQCEKEFPDAAQLELAQINLRKFQDHFPTEERVSTAEKMIFDMKEKFAQDLFTIGRFYERRKKNRAAAMYYLTISKRYPETKTALLATSRLHNMEYPPIDTTPPSLKKMDKEPLLVVDHG